MVIIIQESTGFLRCNDCPDGDWLSEYETPESHAYDVHNTKKFNVVHYQDIQEDDPVMANRTIESEIAWHVAQIRADLSASAGVPSRGSTESAAFDKGWRHAYQVIANDIEYRALQRAETDKEVKVDGR